MKAWLGTVRAEREYFIWTTLMFNHCSCLFAPLYLDRPWDDNAVLAQWQFSCISVEVQAARCELLFCPHASFFPHCTTFSSVLSESTKHPRTTSASPLHSSRFHWFTSLLFRFKHSNFLNLPLLPILFLSVLFVSNFKYTSHRVADRTSIFMHFLHCGMYEIKEFFQNKDNHNMPKILRLKLSTTATTLL